MEQERLMCFNADTGKLLWEHRYNMFTSDVPAASPRLVVAGRRSRRPATCSRSAATAWSMSLSTRTASCCGSARSPKSTAMWTTHGGRMSTPIIDGDQLIVSGLDVRLGTDSGAARTASSRSTRPTARSIWVSAPEGRPTDTIYANPYVADVNGVADVLLGRQRRRDARAQDRDRRAGVALERQQARPEYRRADGRLRRHRHPQRREHGRRTRWACSPRCRRRRRAR